MTFNAFNAFMAWPLVEEPSEKKVQWLHTRPDPYPGVQEKSGSDDDTENPGTKTSFKEMNLNLSKIPGSGALSTKLFMIE